MASKPISPELSQVDDTVLLRHGQRLDQATFHARYDKMPEDVKYELIAGVVYMQSALKAPHGRYHSLLMAWLGQFWTATPGTDALDNTTVILGDDSEPQPDASLLIVGGQTHVDENDYLVGPPEFVAEVSDTTERIDLGAKHTDYERWSVQEYLVILVQERRVAWFARNETEFEELSPDDDGIMRSPAFPGLWLDSDAFFHVDAQRVQDVLNEGLATREHAEFVELLSRT